MNIHDELISQWTTHSPYHSIHTAHVLILLLHIKHPIRADTPICILSHLKYSALHLELLLERSTRKTIGKVGFFFLLNMAERYNVHCVNYRHLEIYTFTRVECFL